MPSTASGGIGPPQPWSTRLSISWTAFTSGERLTPPAPTEPLIRRSMIASFLPVRPTTRQYVRERPTPNNRNLSPDHQPEYSRESLVKEGARGKWAALAAYFPLAPGPPANRVGALAREVFGRSGGKFRVEAMRVSLGRCGTGCASAELVFQFPWCCPSGQAGRRADDEAVRALAEARSLGREELAEDATHDASTSSYTVA